MSLAYQTSVRYEQSKKMKIRGNSDNNECPCCGEQETMAHIMACKGKVVVQNFNDVVKNLDQKMIKLNFEPYIQTVIKGNQKLGKWHQFVITHCHGLFPVIAQ